MEKTSEHTVRKHFGSRDDKPLIEVRLFADCSTVMLACLSSEAGEAPQTNRIASVVKFKLIQTNYVLIQICSNVTFL